MTAPERGDARWLAVYAAAFVAEHMEARRRGRCSCAWPCECECGLGAALDDESVDRATEEGEALADWEMERRAAREP